ncbi:tripartite tricarboxylate transporter substrate-binding protein [Geodermatophilus sp. YIM 151500]|uniref:Bug family tripartite tricarboxylate transporter substrate binding protein n=1 Tax=Geodermatophilus sp. YIM 151500 TaxID=2984531 RepID=UPI0021E4396C|nr:tripartite tricarboxylate transporter substrate-binding protein [Geodermatophilus sp. YIM 151500]MCV2491163.1 tripartite tricarboxylate transporter substrate-binding protein [Geodermatophilus sp. YIM 151500]
MRNTKVIAAGAAAVLSLTLAACGGDSGGEGGSGSGSEAAGYPEASEDLDWTIAFGPGGGNDIMARTIVDILEKNDLYPGNIVVQNREGGSGATGWGYLYSQAGEGYGISTTSGSFITTPLQADTGWQPSDFTPVGLMATDDAVFLVPGSSPVKTWDQWVETAKSERLVVGGIGTVNVDFIVSAMLADQAGYEVEYVPFNEEGQLITSLLSGAVDAIVSNPAEILGQVEAGELTPLLTTADERIDALPDTPTDQELGFEGIPSMPRGMILPPDAPEEAQTWWIDTMTQVVETPEWREYIEGNYLTEDIRWGEEFAAYLQETQSQFEEILTEAGAL